MGYTDTERKIQHPAAVVAGTIVSVVVHVTAILLLSGFRFDMGYRIDEDLRRRKENKMDVREVALKPDPVMLAMKPLAIAASPVQDSAVAMDVAQVAENTGAKPEAVAIEPPTLQENRLAGENRSVSEPSALPDRQKWEPRQEIVEIEKKLIDDKVKALARKPIEKVDRVKNAPDIVMTIDRSKMDKNASSGMSSTNLLPPDLDKRVEGGRAGIDGGKSGISGLRNTGAGPTVKSPSSNEEPLFTRGSGTNTFKPIEKYLKAELTTYASSLEPEYGYFKIEIARLGDEILPVIPKDIILVQDCSTSMAEQRLHFCRDGLTNCLQELAPGDRFNVVSFRDTREKCFQEWAEVKPETIGAARQFISEMRASGDTDIYSSLKHLLEPAPTPGRPVIALMISDGYSTAGIVDNSDIIGAFSKLNNGAISVFSLGTLQTANMYLLDLVSHCNRGDAFNVTSGRWDIPKSIHNLLKEVKRPVLSDVKFTFAGGDRCMVYPVLTSNLYLDRPLILHGRYNKDMKNVVFQAIGKAGAVDCDMVFDLDIGKAGKPGGKDIRTEWAEQRVYFLMGEYARNGDPAVLRELKETANSYKIKVPYARDLPK
ncbi:MAG: hypothetical protein C0404_06425 [Verrucomicrobia bacterium]|nr:hypothetical protein [Verrucomicrobiota bacterium]